MKGKWGGMKTAKQIAKSPTFIVGVFILGFSTLWTLSTTLMKDYQLVPYVGYVIVMIMLINWAFKKNNNE